MDRSDKIISDSKLAMAVKKISFEALMMWIKRWECFYKKQPYSANHYWRNMRMDGVIADVVTETEVKKILEKLCQQKRMIRVGEEYMLHPDVAGNAIYVNAFLKK